MAFIPLQQKTNFNLIKKYVKVKVFVTFVIMSSKDTEILEFNWYQKWQFIFYEDLECVIEKCDGCKNNPKNPSTTKVGEHIPSSFPMSTISSFKSIENKHDIWSSFSMSTISSFKRIENKHDAYRGKDCMKNFYKYLPEHAMQIINFKKKEMRLLTN